MAKAPPKIPLKQILSALDRCDLDYYNRLDEDAKKAFVPFVMMRYASNTGNKALYHHYITMVNDLCNVNFSVLSKHPELFWKLLATAGVGTDQFHKFIPPAKKAKKSKIQEFLHKLYPTYKLADLEMLEKINSKEQLGELLRNHGYEEKEIKEMLK